AQTLRSFRAALLHTPHLGRLLEQLPALGRSARDYRLDVVLVDDRVRVDRESRRREQVQQVAAAHPRSVQEVVALPVALDTACDRDLVVVDRQAPSRVVEDHRYLGERGSRAALTPGEDDLFHLAAADVFRLAGAEHPLDSIDDVGLPGAVRPDDPGDTALEADLAGT